MQKFGFGHARGDDWQTATLACAAQIEPPKGANLGFVYITDALASDLENITTVLTQETGVADWVGTIGVGICATGKEYFGERAVAAMVGCFPDGSFSIFDSSEDKRMGFAAQGDSLATRNEVYFAVVHADPRDPEMMQRVPDFAEEAGCFLVGGLASSRGAYAQIAGSLNQLVYRAEQVRFRPFFAPLS